MGMPVTFSSGNAVLIPSEAEKRIPLGVGRVLPLWKERISPLAKMTHQNVESQCPHFHQGLPAHLHPNSLIPFFPNQCPLFNSRYPVRRRVQLYCNSVNHRISLCIWFSAILAFCLQEIRVSFWVEREALRSFLGYMSWKFKSLSSSFYSTPLFNNNQSTNCIL